MATDQATISLSAVRCSSNASPACNGAASANKVSFNGRSSDGSEAVRRPVRLGRRNTDFIEVLDGLEPGEKVITSPYTSYVGMDRLTLD